MIKTLSATDLREVFTQSIILYQPYVIECIPLSKMEVSPPNMLL